MCCAGLLGGLTEGPNRYGPDPLQIGLTGNAGAGRGEKFATIALLTLSAAVLVAGIGASYRARATWPMVRGPFRRISPDARRTGR